VTIPSSLKFASEREIMTRAFELPGYRLGELADWLRSPARLGGKARGDVGEHVERLFGLVPNSAPEPDFPTAAIELKTVPLRERGRGWVPKERTTIALIDYIALAGEASWAQASVRKKLSKILFVFFKWLGNVSLSTLEIDSVYLWSPDAKQLTYLEHDWETIHEKVRRGQAHLLSDRDSVVLAATTKARDSHVRRPQVRPGPPAKPRAFTLKQSFMDCIYHDESLRRANVESLMDNLGISRVADFERTVSAQAARFVGRRIGDIGDAFAIPGKTSKSYAARVVRRALGATRTDARVREFDEFGIEVKIVALPLHGRPFESMSFPAFRYGELVDETWDVAELREQLQRLLIVPVYSEERKIAQPARRLGAPFFWTPNEADWEMIHAEWSMFQREIRNGRARDLTPASETRCIHVRPHAQDSGDTDVAPKVGRLVKKSFWLNQDYLAAVIEEHAAI
jgi:DNA mismatch repair protein MutH